MAEGGKGDVVVGRQLMTPAAATTHITSPTNGDDADSDDPLLDISKTGIYEGTNVTAKKTGSRLLMEHGDYYYSSCESETTEHPRAYDNVDLKDQQHGLPHSKPNENLEPNNSCQLIGTFLPSHPQVRYNPFDFPARDLRQSVRRDVVIGTGNCISPERNGYDEYDPINFGDPTFVNSYSTTPNLLTSSRQNLVSPTFPIIPSKTQTSKSIQKGKTVLENVNWSGTAFKSAFPDPSLKSTPVPCLDPHRFLAYKGEPGESVFSSVDTEAKTGNLCPTSSNLSNTLQHGFLESYPSKCASVLNFPAAPTIGKLGVWLDNPVENYNFQNPDLILEDYTSLPKVTRETSTQCKNMTHHDCKNTRPESAKSENNPPIRRIGEAQRCMRDGFQVDSELSVNLRMNLKHETDLVVNGGYGSQHRVVGSISDNRFAEVSNLSSRPLDQLDSFVKERVKSASRGESMFGGGLSPWDDGVNMDRHLEETPLLETGIRSEHHKAIVPGVVSTSSGTSREAALHLSHIGIASHTRDKAPEYRSNAHRYSSYSDSPTEDHEDCGLLKKSEHGKHARGVVEDTRAIKTCSSQNSSSLFQRNSYGDFIPLPHFVENGGVEYSDSGELSSSSSTPFRHCHKRRMTSLTDKLARRQLISVVILCVIFMIGETVGGILANSLALFTDVLHLGSDLISFIISLLAMWLANKPATRKMSFGYHRAEVIGALVSVLFIWLISGVLCYIAVERIIHEHYKSVRADEMLITAALGVLFNFVMGFVLHSEMCCGHAHSHNKFGHGHSHDSGGHGHSHNHTKDDHLDVPHGTRRSENVGSRQSFDYQRLHHDQSEQQMRDVNSMPMAPVVQELHSDEDHPCADEEPTHKQKNINVRAAFIHVVGDIIQSLGVLVAALIIKFTTDLRYRLADPICTFLFSLLVLITTIAVLRDTLLVIMEGVPRNLSIESVRKELAAIDGVVTVHNLHIWALTLDRNALSVHLVVENAVLHNQVLSSATKLLQDKHHFFHCTIQVELLDEIAMKNCKECMEWT